jgi:hypothetical protein
MPITFGAECGGALAFDPAPRDFPAGLALGAAGCAIRERELPEGTTRAREVLGREIRDAPDFAGREPLCPRAPPEPCPERARAADVVREDRARAKAASPTSVILPKHFIENSLLSNSVNVLSLIRTPATGHAALGFHMARGLALEENCFLSLRPANFWGFTPCNGKPYQGRTGQAEWGTTSPGNPS